VPASVDTSFAKKAAYCFVAVCTARYDSKYDDKKDYDKYSKDSKYEK
jgi:hypothetical protein